MKKTKTKKIKKKSNRKQVKRKPEECELLSNLISSVLLGR